MIVKKFYFLAKNTLFPINRSITGDGIKKTLNIIKKQFPKLRIKKIKSGTKIFDWKIPNEWNVTDAYIEDKFGKKIVDFKKNNLHLVGYSIPIQKRISKKNLLKNIYSLKTKPNAIPYITSYYKKRWGFCMSHNQKNDIIKNYQNKDNFKIVIKSKLNPRGYLNYGEIIIKGKNKKEILISTYICHHSMDNNELICPIVDISLIKYF